VAKSSFSGAVSVPSAAVRAEVIGKHFIDDASRLFNLDWIDVYMAGDRNQRFP
jgi:hypothetical protein